MAKHLTFPTLREMGLPSFKTKITISGLTPQQIFSVLLATLALILLSLA